MTETPIMIKSRAFAVRIVKLYKYLSEEKHEYVLSKQVLKSGTSIGANVHEAIQSPSQKDFAAKMGIALKEASETEYWIRLLFDTNYISEDEYNSIQADCSELNKILISIINKTAAD